MSSDKGEEVSGKDAAEKAASPEGASSTGSESEKPGDEKKEGFPWKAITTIVTLGLAVWTAIQKYGEYETEKSRHEAEAKTQQVKQEHDEKMAELQLRHTIEMDYLNALKDDEQRLRTLRMVEATTTDPKMKEWARAEREIIDTKKGELEQQRRDQEKRADDAEKKLAVAIQSGRIRDAELARLRADAFRERAKLNRLNEQSPPVSLGPTAAASVDAVPPPSAAAVASSLGVPMPRMTHSDVLGASEGWWCGTVEVSMCWRSKADCVADRDNGGGQCEYVPHARCFKGSDSEIYCYRGDLGCDTWSLINGSFSKDKQTPLSKCSTTY